MIWVFGSALLIILILSAWANVFLLRRLMDVSDNTEHVLSVLEDFSKHISKVYGLERYYGDETLLSLLEHSQDTISDIEEFQNAYGGGVSDETEDPPP